MIMARMDGSRGPVTALGAPVRPMEVVP